MPRRVGAQGFTTAAVLCLALGMQMDPQKNRGNHSWSVWGRVRPGVTSDQVRLDLRAIAARLAVNYPSSNTGWSVLVEPLRDNQVGNLRPALLLMMAVRLALGASRWRVVRQLLIESILIALVGAALGVGVAYGSLGSISRSIPSVPAWMQFTIDWQVLAFTLGVAVLTGVLFGLVPALHAARPDPNETLRDAGARGTSAGRTRQRLRSSLVIAEVALSVVLLVGAVGQEPLLEIRWVSPRYLDVLRVPVVRGRMFTLQEWADSGVAGRVAVINDHMARQLWGGADAALGKRFTFQNPNTPSTPWFTIIASRGRTGSSGCMESPSAPSR